jgi:hypothetical protein
MRRRRRRMGGDEPVARAGGGSQGWALTGASGLASIPRAILPVCGIALATRAARIANEPVALVVYAARR